MAVDPISSGVGASVDISTIEPPTPALPVTSSPTQDHVGAGTTPAADSNAAILANISAPDLAKLAAILEPTHSPQSAALLQNLLQDTRDAVSHIDAVRSHSQAETVLPGDDARAIANLGEIARLDPAVIETLRVDPALAPIRPEMERLLHQVTAVAKMDAEGSLVRAGQFIESNGARMLPNWQTRPETLMQVAHRLFDTGGYTNYVRSAQVAQAIIDYSPWIVNYAPGIPAKARTGAAAGEDALQTAVRKSWVDIRNGAPSKIARLWERAPLLVLLVGWLGLGLVAGPISLLFRSAPPGTWPASIVNAFYDIWAIGFLALAGFGFYARVRTVRF